jgi:hypothetical protein
MMCESLKDIKWHNVCHAVTAFVTVITMPLTYSIAYGLIAGIGIWIVLELTFLFLGLFGISRPEEDDPAETAKAPTDEDGIEDSTTKTKKTMASNQSNDMDKSRYSKTQELAVEDISEEEIHHDGSTGSNNSSPDIES